jgi:hypothetical protein
MQWFEQPVVNGLPRIGFGEGFTGQAETVHRRGYAAINADLEQDFANLFTAQAIAQGAANVQLELVGPVERGNHGQVYHAALFERQALAAPDMAPAVFGDQLLQRLGEVVGVLDRAVDVVLAQHLGADLQAFFVLFVAHVQYSGIKQGPQPRVRR